MTDHEKLAEAFRLCFRDEAGRVVLEYLRKAYLERRLPPVGTTTEQLWHAEGERNLAGWIIKKASEETA